MNSTKLTYIDESLARRLTGKKKSYDVDHYEEWGALAGEFISPACTYLPLFSRVVVNESETSDTTEVINESISPISNDGHVNLFLDAYKNIVSDHDGRNVNFDESIRLSEERDVIETLAVPLKEFVGFGQDFKNGILFYAKNLKEAMIVLQTIATEKPGSVTSAKVHEFPKDIDLETSDYLLNYKKHANLFWQVPVLGDPGSIYKIPDNITWMIGYNVFNVADMGNEKAKPISLIDIKPTVAYKAGRGKGAETLYQNLLVVYRPHTGYIPTKFNEAYTPLFVYNTGQNRDLTATGTVAVCRNRKVFAECALTTNSPNLYGKSGCSLDEWGRSGAPKYVWVCLNGSAALDGVQVAFRSNAWKYENIVKILQFWNMNPPTEVTNDKEDKEGDSTPEVPFVSDGKNPYSEKYGEDYTVKNEWVSKEADQDLHFDVDYQPAIKPQTQAKKTNSNAGLIIGLAAAALLLNR